MKKYIIVAVVAILIPLVSLYLKRQYLCILEKDEKKILYLMSLVRDDNTEPQVGANEFFLRFKTYSKSRSQGSDMSDNYVMHVIPQGDSYCTKILLMSSTLYEKGENIGHADPTGEWSDCGNAFMDVLDYYFKHKSKIKIIPKRMNPNN